MQFKQLHHGHSLHLCGSLTSRLSGLTAEESGTGRCSRFQLMVVAQSPFLVLPLSAQLLAVDLGILEIQFQAAGAEGTTSTRKLNNLRSRSSDHSHSLASYGNSQGLCSARRSASRSTAFVLSSDEEWSSLPPFSPPPCHKRLLDVMHIHLCSIDLTVGEHLSVFKGLQGLLPGLPLQRGGYRGQEAQHGTGGGQGPREDMGANGR